MRTRRDATQNFGDTLDILVPLTARHWILPFFLEKHIFETDLFYL